jgi:transketolase
MRHDPESLADRDRFILSSHCCPILYAVMAECGYCPKDKLMTCANSPIYQASRRAVSRS